MLATGFPDFHFPRPAGDLLVKRLVALSGDVVQVLTPSGT
jgi:hypothetical protein